MFFEHLADASVAALKRLIIIISVFVNILCFCYRFIYFYIVLYSCFKVGEEDVLVISMGDEDGTGTAEHLSAEALELRRIASE